MASLTVTAALAAGGIQPKANHAGVNVVTGDVLLTVSASPSGVAWLCKVPANAIITRFSEQHGNVATDYGVNFGFKHGTSASYTVAALLSDAQKDTSNQSGLVPYVLSRDDAASEKFKYLVASVVDASDTGTMSLKYSIEYIMPGQSSTS